MNKVLLTVLYPFWFFLSKTWLGNVIMIPVVIGLPMLPFSSMLEVPATGPEIGILWVVIDLLVLTPLMIIMLMYTTVKLEEVYEAWGWKTVIEE